MATVTSATAKVLSLVGSRAGDTKDTSPVRYNEDISLDVTVHSRVREMRRDGMITRWCRRDLTATTAPRHISFPYRYFESCGMMRHVLREVLGEAVMGLSVDQFATRLLDHVTRTRELHLVAEVEVVHVKVLGHQESGAIGRLKRECGFLYLGHELGTCSVCLNNLSGDLIRTPSCSHHYHQSCILRWLEKKNSCPLCRTNIL